MATPRPRGGSFCRDIGMWPLQVLGAGYCRVVGETSLRPPTLKHCGGPVRSRGVGSDVTCWGVLARTEKLSPTSKSEPTPIESDDMSFSRADIPNLRGKTAVITGANGGLGLATAKAFAAKGAHVVLAVRNQEKAQRAVDEIRGESPQASLELVRLDLGSQESIRDAAREILDNHEEVDLLINNAGVMAPPAGRTSDGFETQFGVNHLGHWSLTALLMSGILAASAARVVTVTSLARLNGKPVDRENPHLVGVYDPWAAYGQSKLANSHFALGLEQLFESAGVSAISLRAHPGLSSTDLMDTTREASAGEAGGLSEKFTKRFAMTAEEGAMSQIRAAVDPRAKGGELFGPLFGISGPAVRRLELRRPNEEAIRTLWTLSEQETGIAMTVKPNLE